MHCAWFLSRLTLGRRHLPEAFLWEVFYYLVQAAASMETGPRDAKWSTFQIVHRDIKPENGQSLYSFPVNSSFSFLYKRSCGGTVPGYGRGETLLMIPQRVPHPSTRW